ncbi:cell wall-binding repeat-containing protein [Schumannella luteola]
MKRSALALALLAAVVGGTFVAAAPAQAIPTTTAQSCNDYSMSPIRGTGEHPPVLGVRNAPIGLPEFDSSLGELVSATISTTATATVQGSVTNKTGTAQPFTIRVGGPVSAGKDGANGYASLGSVAAVVPTFTVGANQSNASIPLTSVTASASKTYDAALWATLPAGFVSRVVIEDEGTNTGIFSWNLTRDDVYFLMCVTYTYQPYVDRVAGADRFETSADIALASYPGGADTVYVATGQNYPDALAAGPAAAAEGAPLLLVPSTGALPLSIRTALDALDPANIVVVGGTPSVSAAVYSELSGYSDSIERVAGADRFETSRLLAERIYDHADFVFIATGLNFPDALSAGPAAFVNDAPVILVNGGSSTLDAATADLVESLGTQTAVIVGGTPSVSLGIQTDLDAILPDAIRFPGADRFETSRLVNEYAFYQPTETTAFFATGLGFPDALAGSAWAAAQGAPLYVIPPTCVPTATMDGLEFLGVSNVVLLGGLPSLGTPVEDFTPCS